MEAATASRTGRFTPRRVLAAYGDERLVGQVRAGNAAAFEVLYDRHYRGLLSFSRHMLGSREEAEDALQQSFLSAYRGMLDDERPINFQPWAYTIARNRCLSVLRARRETASEDVEPSTDTDGLADEVEQRTELRNLVGDLGRLPEDQRAALILTELSDFSHVQVAEVLEVPSQKVKALVFQARETLMGWRKARETPCVEIREQLSVMGGRASRKGEVRRHIATCEACAEFESGVRGQKAMLAVVLPVFPTLALKETALAAALTGGGGSAGGGAVVGGSAAGGTGAGAIGGGAVAAKIGGVKIAAIAAVAGVTAVGGGAAVISRGGDTPSVQRTQAGEGGGTGGQASGAPPASSQGGGSPSGADAARDRQSDARKRDQRRRERRRREQVTVAEQPAPTEEPAPVAFTPAPPPSGGGGGGSNPPPSSGDEGVSDEAFVTEEPLAPPPAPVQTRDSAPCAAPVPSNPQGGAAPSPC